MKISKLKEVVKSILKERSINAISKLQQDNLDKISKALDFYKKNKHTDKREPFIKLLKKLGDEKKKLAKELDMKVSGMYKDAEYKGESVVNEIAKFAGWVAIDHKGKRLEIKKSEAKDLYNAKLFAIKKLKVPKSKESMLAIKPAYNESVNEASKEAMGIAALTGTRGSAVEDFINKHELNGKKLFKSITKANLRGRLNFVSALAGKDGNPNQKLTIKLHKENFNEELSTELAFEVITFMERPVMETVMVDEFEKSDIVEMLVNEGINDVLTEGVKAEFNTLVETYNKK